MNWSEILSALFMLIGVLFVFFGAVGLLRFPCIFTRLHPLTMVDNMGFAFLALGASFQIGSLGDLFKIWLIWFLTILSSATVSHLIGRNTFLHHNDEESEK
jgi:multicomponent Na+:H+ antiporter subunit G